MYSYWQEDFRKSFWSPPSPELEGWFLEFEYKSIKKEPCEETCIVCCTLSDLWMNSRLGLAVFSISHSATKSNFWCVTAEFPVRIMAVK